MTSVAYFAYLRPWNDYLCVLDYPVTKAAV